MNHTWLYLQTGRLLLLLWALLPSWAIANVEFGCTQIRISTEVNWLPPGASRDVSVRWIVVVGPDTDNLRPSKIEIEGTLPTEAAQQLRRAASNMRCNVKAPRGRAHRWTSPTEFALAATVRFRARSQTPEASAAPAAQTRGQSVSAPSSPPEQEFNPIEQRIQLKVSIGRDTLDGKDCRISAPDDQLGFPMNIKSGRAFVTPRTLTSNLLIASCEVLPYITLSQSVVRDSATGLFPSLLEIQISDEEFADLKASSEAEIRRIEEELAAELANQRRQAERDRIEAEAERQRQIEAQQARELERQQREEAAAAERAERQRRLSILNDALGLLESAQGPLLNYYEINRRWPVALTGPESFAELLEQYATEYAFNLRLTQSSITPFASAIVSVTLYNSEIEGNLSLAYDDRIQQWSCFSTDIAEEFLPSSCGTEKPDFPIPTSVFDF